MRTSTKHQVSTIAAGTIPIILTGTWAISRSSVIQIIVHITEFFAFKQCVANKIAIPLRVFVAYYSVPTNPTFRNKIEFASEIIDHFSQFRSLVSIVDPNLYPSLNGEALVAW